MSIKAVVFDIGNVLIGWRPERYFTEAVGQERADAFFAAVDLYDMNDRGDRGEDFAAVLAEMIGTYPEFAHELGLWRDHWIDLTGPEIERSVRILHALRRADVLVYALSNFGAETFGWAEARYPFLTEFDAQFISGRMGIAKPDAEIYQRVEAAIGIDPGAIFFVDDRRENIAAARARGWQGHVFENEAGFAGAIVAHGLLSEEQAA